MTDEERALQIEIGKILYWIHLRAEAIRARKRAEAAAQARQGGENALTPLARGIEQPRGEKDDHNR